MLFDVCLLFNNVRTTEQIQKEFSTEIGYQTGVKNVQQCNLVGQFCFVFIKEAIVIVYGLENDMVVSMEILNM